MKISPFHDDSSDRPEGRLEENDPVWQLLGESPRPEPDAWSVARTMARCRLAGAAGVASWRGMWRWALGGGLGFSLAMVLLVTQVHSHSAMPESQKKVQEAFEIVASLNASDSDSSTSSSSWQDSSL